MKKYLHAIRNRMRAVVLLSLLLFLSVNINNAFAEFTFEDEKKLGKEFYDKLEKSNVLVKDAKVQKYINDLGYFILTKSNPAPFDFRFHVIKSSAINAFATPGGYVYVNMGLIALTETESELASVLAHEIAHVNSRHIASLISKSQKINIAALAAIIAGAFFGGGGELSSAVMGFSLATATHLSLKYTREHEEEADRLGMSYLSKAGYDVSAMIEFLKLMRRYEYYSNSVPSYFLTHPETDARIRYLDSLLQTTYKTKGKNSLFKGFNKIRTAMIADGDLQSALKYFQNQLESKPNDASSLYGLAVVQSKLGMLPESFASLKKAYAAAPNDGDILRELGSSYVRSGKNDEGLPYLLKAYEIDEDDIDSAMSLGKAYEALGDYSKALYFYKKIENRDQSDEEIFYNLAMVYGKMKESGESHYYFGIFFKKKNKQQSALFHFQQALKQYATNAQRREAIEEEINALKKMPKSN